MPRQDILRQIYRIPTYMESYTPTRLDFRCSLINLIIHYFTQFNTSFHCLPFRAYRLGQGVGLECGIKVSKLARLLNVCTYAPVPRKRKNELAQLLSKIS
jgi:hypothetical protein